MRSQPWRVAALALLLAAFVRPAVARTIRAPAEPVTRILIKKKAHELQLLQDATVVARYRVAIGPGGDGFKRQEGDKVTPVGHYRIVARQTSQFHVFMRLDYPNAEDRARFDALKAKGELPKDARIGGDIGIHGAPAQTEWKATHKDVDWTLGCIAVDDAEIDAIAARVKNGTPVDIED